jgi:hypothetical protein
MYLSHALCYDTVMATETDMEASHGDATDVLVPLSIPQIKFLEHLLTHSDPDQDERACGVSGMPSEQVWTLIDRFALASCE